MNKKEFRKNRLDIEYKFLAQQAIVYLTLSTVTVLGFMGYMIAQGLLSVAFSIGSFTAVLAGILFVGTKRKMDAILHEIDQL